MLIEISNEKINFTDIKINSNNIKTLNAEDYIMGYDNEKYSKITKELIYKDFLESIFLFRHNLRNFNIKYPEENITVFYTKSAEQSPWTIIIYDNKLGGERKLDPNEEEDKELYEKYNIEDEPMEIFYNHLGDISFTKKNEDINFKIIKDNFLGDLEELYNKDFNEILIIQYLLKNELPFAIVEEFSTDTIQHKMDLKSFHRFVFENINIFTKYKNVETAIQELFLKKTLCIELSSLKKYNSLFSSKIPMPGLYLYKYMVNYIRLLNEKSIPPRKLKKRGRKPKNPKPEEKTGDEEE